MSVLSDRQVNKLVKRKYITIDPYFDVFQGPNCYHCHLGNNFKRLSPELSVLNPLNDSSDKLYENFVVESQYEIKPGEFVLGETFEFLGTSPDYVIKLLNSSSLARVGVSQAALGMINAGCGMESPIKLTLELLNNSPVPIILKPTKILSDKRIVWGTEVLKITLVKMDKPPSIPYDRWKYGVYSGDKGVAGSKMAKRFPEDNFILPKKSLHKKTENHD